MNEQSHFWISLFQWIRSFSSIRKNIMLYLKMCFIFLAKNISEILWRNFCVKSQFSSYHLKQSKQEKKIQNSIGCSHLRNKSIPAIHKLREWIWRAHNFLWRIHRNNAHKHTHIHNGWLLHKAWNSYSSRAHSPGPYIKHVYKYL